ncbi:hypothetical protein ILUMI_26604 [Ignelater luminosus]|uniref:Uncharacterized protein n=1 Tax=Ignelater luminosus TaxID=2038154 RepID=A0A8K0C485_IGNLU|nr:hypothetical protein ILUMI_26604 [Ignelater luminosus]
MSTHVKVAEQFPHVIQHPEDMPTFITEAQYRPIACLLILYKILTARIANRIYNHVKSNGILAEQQKECRRKHTGRKEQLVIESVVLRQAHKEHRNLRMVYIDYQKAHLTLGLSKHYSTHNLQVRGLRQFYSKQSGSELHSAVCVVNKKSTPPNLNNVQLSLQIESHQGNIASWTQKALHGRHANDVSQQHVDKVVSNYWLTEGSLFAETEGFMMAIQY